MNIFFKCNMLIVLLILCNYGFTQKVNPQNEKLAIPAIYDWVLPFSEGKATVEIGAEWNNGITPSTRYNGINGDWRFIDNTGKEILNLGKKYFLVRSCHEGMIAVAKRSPVQPKGIMIAKHTWGFINAKGKETVSPKYDYVADFHDGIAAVNIGGKWGDPLFIGGKWGFIDLTGKELIPLKYNAVCATFTCDGIIYNLAASEKLIAVNTGGVGKVLSTGESCVVGGKWGFIDYKGKITIPFIYDDVTPFSEGLAAVCIYKNKKKKWGYVNNKGKVIISLQYTEQAKMFSEGLASVVGSQKQTGYINKVGKMVIPGYSGRNFSSGYANIGEFYIDKSGSEKFKGLYNYTEDFIKGYALVSKEGGRNSTSMIINKTGSIVVPAKFENMMPYSEGMVAVELNNKWGYISINAPLSNNH